MIWDQPTQKSSPYLKITQHKKGLSRVSQIL
jgi:hypothetical protein